MSREISGGEKISVIDLAAHLWSKKWFLVKVIIAFCLSGLFIGFTSKAEYTTYSKLMPESQDGFSPELGGLGGLAGLAGINLKNQGGGSLTPEIYPEIVKSTPFIDDLINSPIYFENIDSVISSYEYFKELDKPSILGMIADYTFGLPGKINILFQSAKEDEMSKTNQLIRFSKDDWKIYEKYAERLSVTVDPETGNITISSKMPDAMAAAMTVEMLVTKLTTQIIQYKTEKSQLNLKFIKNSFEEAKIEYETKQRELALFSDRNKNITSSTASIEFERLQNQVNISFEVYKGLATQLEQAKIKVKEETPAFTILEPTKVPVEKSNMRKLYVIIISIIAGIAIGAIYVIFKAPFLSLIKEITNK